MVLLGRARNVAWIAIVLGVLWIAAGSASAAGWLPPANVSSPVPGTTKEDISLQDVAVDGEGNAVAVWVQGTGGPEIVEAATRPAGGSWSSPVEVSDPGEDALGLQVVVNADGDAAAIWAGYGSGGESVVRVATRPAGGPWSDPAAISDAERYAVEPEIAIDGEGNLTAAWSESEGHWEYGVVEAATRPAGGAWSEPVELSEGSAISPRVAVDSEGDVTAVWNLLGPNRDDGTIQSKTRAAGGEWSAEAVDVSGAGGLAADPEIAIEPDGDATVVWQQQDIPDFSGFHRFVQTARRVDGTWSEPLTISKDDGLAGQADVTVDPEGNATAIWLYFGTARFLQVRSRGADGSWGQTVNLVTRSGGLEPSEDNLQVEADPQGNVTALWQAWAAPNIVVRSARRPSGGSWSNPDDVSAPGAYSIWPQMAIDPQGHATVVWSGFQANAHAVRSRVFDPVAPELLDLEVPESGVVGQPVEMSVDPFDLWPPVAISWDFGDGGSGSDAAVDHLYCSPGERTVTVTGVDLAGNASSASQTIEIESGPDHGQCPDPNPHPDPRPEPGPGPGPGSDPGPGNPRIAPVVSGLRQSSSRWRTRAATRQPGLPVGTTFRFRLNRAATARLQFSRFVPGRGGYERRGTVSVSAAAGPNAFPFAGRIRGRTLAPGRYRVRVTALADGLTSAPASIRFSIAR